MPQRGIVYFVFNHVLDAHLDRSMESVEKWHPDLPIHIHRQDGGDLLDKAGMLDVSPFDTTLYLDADTVVLGDLAYGFDQAEQYGLACCLCECPWARRYPSIHGDVREFNTGVLFFTKDAKPVFDCWRSLARNLDSSIRFYHGKDVVTMPSNDQAGFAAAVESLGFNPFVLPMNWNARPIWQKSFFGEIKVWHDYKPVPKSLLKWNEDQSRPNAIIQYATFD